MEVGAFFHVELKGSLQQVVSFIEVGWIFRGE